MSGAGSDPARPRRSGLSEFLVLALAMLLCLWVAAANGRVLFYFDTATYIDRGLTLLSSVGLEMPPEAPADDAAANDAAEGPGATAGVEEDNTVDGSRSVVYSLILALFALPRALEAVVALNAAVAVLAIWLPVRIALRIYAPQLSPARVTFAATALAALGSLPFYVAFLMPDILTPVLLLMAATLTAFAGRMRGWELGLAFLLGSGAVLCHLSHQAIAVLLVPLTLILALILGGRRRLLAPLLVTGMVLVGVAEQAALRKMVAVQTDQRAEVIYLPFLTARLIQDRVGLTYLDRTCPDAAIPTCALHAALQLSNDPYRLTASHIVFERSDRLGSFRLMSQDDQRRVAQAQFGFFFDVLRDQPLGTTLAFLGNTLLQARMNSVDMTLPSPTMIAILQDAPGLGLTDFGAGRLVTDKADWLAWADPAQQALYFASLIVILAAVIRPSLPGRVRVFLLMALLGILVNAFVCGGVSQPATRYGARVIWLLPVLAVLAAALLRQVRADPRLALRPMDTAT